MRIKVGVRVGGWCVEVALQGRFSSMGHSEEDLRYRGRSGRKWVTGLTTRFSFPSRLPSCFSQNFASAPGPFKHKHAIWWTYRKTLLILRSVLYFNGIGFVKFSKIK